MEVLYRECCAVKIGGMIEGVSYCRVKMLFDMPIPFIWRNGLPLKFSQQM
ncbi:MAG: hypothetical protein IJQ58_02430 [Synergistaceae bacterium]|nr:hypothetical protein [Synergistaceae bacterium]